MRCRLRSRRSVQTRLAAVSCWCPSGCQLLHPCAWLPSGLAQNRPCAGRSFRGGSECRSRTRRACDCRAAESPYPSDGPSASDRSLTAPMPRGGRSGPVHLCPWPGLRCSFRSPRYESNREPFRVYSAACGRTRPVANPGGDRHLGGLVACVRERDPAERSADCAPRHGAVSRRAGRRPMRVRRRLPVPKCAACGPAGALQRQPANTRSSPASLWTKVKCRRSVSDSPQGCPPIMERRNSSQLWPASAARRLLTDGLLGGGGGGGGWGPDFEGDPLCLRTFIPSLGRILLCAPRVLFCANVVASSDLEPDSRRKGRLTAAHETCQSELSSTITCFAWLGRSILRQSGRNPRRLAVQPLHP